MGWAPNGASPDCIIVVCCGSVVVTANLGVSRVILERRGTNLGDATGNFGRVTAKFCKA